MTQYLFSQGASTGCDLIEFYSGEKKSVIIDSLSTTNLFYKSCDESQSLHSIKHQEVSTILENPFLRLNNDPTRQQIKYFNTSRIKSKQGTTPKVSRMQRWFFKKKGKSILKKLDKGIKVTIHYISGNQRKKIKGVLDNINAEYVTIISKSKINIPKAQIIKIKYPRVFSKASKIIGLSGILLGVIIGIFVQLKQVKENISNTTSSHFTTAVGNLIYGTNNPPPSRPKRKKRSGCLFPALIMLIGFLHLAFGGYHKIEDPFHNNWEIKQLFSSNQIEISSIKQIKP